MKVKELKMLLDFYDDNDEVLVYEDGIVKFAAIDASADELLLRGVEEMDFES